MAGGPLPMVRTWRATAGAVRGRTVRPAAERGYGDLREPHLQIFGNLGIDGVRRVAETEQRWARVIGPARFADACRALQQLLDEL